ncbi:putative ribonuclease H-like domain-containing protein [Tanacetum coccineum]
MSHPHPKGNFVPRAVLMKFGLKALNTARQNSSRAAVLVNTARPINTAYPRPTVNYARPASNVFNKAHSHIRRSFNKFTINKNSNFNKKVNTVERNVTTVGPKAVVSDNKGNEANTGNPQLELQEKGVIDSGCSRHMTGNMSYLSDYKEIDGGYVAFGGDPKGGKITGKGKISTDTECVVLSPDFKLLDENQVLLRVPRKDNMYNVDLRNVVPQGGLTCLFAKATLDESNLWHRRLGHINFKTMNKLVRGNLVRGSGPEWLFDIDTLTKSINYEPVVAGNQSNGIAGTKACDNRVQRILLMLDSNHQGRRKRRMMNIHRMKIVSSTVNAAGIKDNAVDENIVYGCEDDLNMPNLEEIVYSDDDEDVGAEADMTNLDTQIPVSPIPTTRIHKDNPVEQIIGDLHSAPQTRRMTKHVTDHGTRKVKEVSKIKAIRIEEEVYVYQPPGFKDLEFPDIVYKRGQIDKTLFIKRVKGDILLVQMSSMGELTFFLGLQVTQKDDGIFISQDKYVDEILKKFGFSTVKTASTPMETSKPLMKDENAEDVDVHLYRSMIRSLIYLTSSRPNIMFAVCTCARFQVTPKVSHLHAVKRIFRYLKGQPKLGLWYPKDSPFILEAYTDSDYAGTSLDKKSTIGAEYVAASNCYGQCCLDRLMIGMDWKCYLDEIEVYTGNSRVSAAMQKFNAAGHYLVLRLPLELQLLRVL